MIDGTNFNYIQKPTKNTVFTKNGNPYQKTGKAKHFTFLSGVGLACYDVIKNKDVFKKAGELVASKPEFKDCKLGAKGASAYLAGVTALKNLGVAALGALVIGGLADGVINKIRAHKADKNAEKPTFLVK